LSGDAVWWFVVIGSALPLAPVAAAPFVGSFLGTLALRLPAGEPVALARSHCPECGHDLGALDLVPVVSWLVAGRRCRYCRWPISLFYPAIELAACAVALWAWLALAPDRLWLGCALGWALLALAIIDLRDFLLPDTLTLPLVVLGLAAAALDGVAALGSRALAAAAGYAVFRLIAVAYRRLRGRDGLGQGDAKLLAAAGAWVSWQGLPYVVLIGCAASLALALGQGLWRRRGLRAGDRLPFGPGLCLGLWIVWLYLPPF
jgi:leader peptidase (prepilin peptidase) / N-methyltransferase